MEIWGRNVYYEGISFRPQSMRKPIAGKVREILHKHGRSVFEQTFKDRDGYNRDFLLFGFKAIPSIVFPLTPDNKVVAIRQFRYGANDFVLEIPGGNTRERQTAEERAGVEVLEETGYTAEKIIRLGHDIWFDPGTFRARYAPLLALGCRKVKEPKLEPTEIIETIEIPLDNWYRKVKEGKEILDSKTLATTALAFFYLEGLPRRG